MTDETLVRGLDRLTQGLIRLDPTSDLTLFERFLLFLSKTDETRLRLLEEQLSLLEGYVMPEHELNRAQWHSYVASIIDYNKAKSA